MLLGLKVYDGSGFRVFFVVNAMLFVVYTVIVSMC